MTATAEMIQFRNFSHVFRGTFRQRADEPCVRYAMNAIAPITPSRVSVSIGRNIPSPNPAGGASPCYRRINNYSIKDADNMLEWEVIYRKVGNSHVETRPFDFGKSSRSDCSISLSARAILARGVV